MLNRFVSFTLWCGGVDNAVTDCGLADPCFDFDGVNDKDRLLDGTPAERLRAIVLKTERREVLTKGLTWEASSRKRAFESTLSGG